MNNIIAIDAIVIGTAPHLKTDIPVHRQTLSGRLEEAVPGKPGGLYSLHATKRDDRGVYLVPLPLFLKMQLSRSAQVIGGNLIVDGDLEQLACSDYVVVEQASTGIAMKKGNAPLLQVERAVPVTLHPISEMQGNEHAMLYAAILHGGWVTADSTLRKIPGEEALSYLRRVNPARLKSIAAPRL